MIRPAQLKLLERARLDRGYDAATFAEKLRRWSGTESVEELSAAGYERAMDGMVLSGFRDRARPVLSTRSLKLLEEARLSIGVSDFAFATMLRSYGKVGDPRDLNGCGLLNLLALLEAKGLDVSQFIAARRQITPTKLRLLQLARKQVKDPDESYYADLQRFGGVNSASDLDHRGFNLMLMLMEASGFERTPTPVPAPGPAFGRRPGFASPEQIDLIRTMWREWIGPTADSDAAIEAGLNAWLERYHRASALRFLTAGGAGKVITALRAMKTRTPKRLHDEKERDQNADAKF